MFRHTTRKTCIGPESFFKYISGQFDKFDTLFDKMDGMFEEIDKSVTDKLGPKVMVEVGKFMGIGPAGALISIELPGVAKESLSVEVQGEIITVSVEHEFTGFTKTFRVDTSVFDLTTLKVRYENGLLTLTLSRCEEPNVEDKRTIPIE